MSRFLPNAKRSLDSLLNLITDLAGDVLLFFRLLFRSRTALSAEVLFLRKQLAFYEERQVQPRRLNDSARFSLILWSRLCNWKEALVIVKPETLIGWHRKGFKLFWKWKSQAGRPRIPENVRKLIVQMAQENPTWGQARVAAELSVKLGIYFSPRTVRAYWPPEPERRGNGRTSSQNWKTFVRNHAQSIVACDFLVVVTTRFRTLYVFLLMEVGTLHRILAEWVTHYNQGRPHLSLGPGIPEPAAVFLPLQGHDKHSFPQDCKVVARMVLGGLHHEYRWERIAA
jgi:putative transposase